MDITCIPLGAGQDVGKSCVIVKLGGKTIMFDCGMHMGFNDHRKFPDFSFLRPNGTFTEAIDCLIITHFHLDHCGALPYFTEVCGYEGPIYMTYPTKALLPLMLEDYRRILSDRKGETEVFSAAHIKACLAKVTAVDLHQLVRVDKELQICAYYAGHVLGAAMFHVTANGASVVYTGDYNMTPDRHLGAAQIDRLEPDLLITESTYATTVRESKRARERDFLNAVHTCVSAGGKVLIPVFALGRAQELCILLDEYWERMRLTIPIYFSAGLTAQANVYYKMLLMWTNQKVQSTFVTRNTFDFPHVSPFDRSQIDAPGPCVLFATPGMLTGGLSLEVFKKWAPSDKNMIILPGYCIGGTVGSRLQAGRKNRVDLDKRSHVDVQCQVHQLSVSAHTDSKGIMDLIRHLAPKHVMLVHGEKPKMAILREKIAKDLDIPCFDPPNHATVTVPVKWVKKVELSPCLIKRQVAPFESTKITSAQSGVVGKRRGREQTKDSVGLGRKLEDEGIDPLFEDEGEGRARMYGDTGLLGSIGNWPRPRKGIPVEGILVGMELLKPRLLDASEVSEVLGLREQRVTFTCTYRIREERPGEFRMCRSEEEALGFEPGLKGEAALSGRDGREMVESERPNAGAPGREKGGGDGARQILLQKTARFDLDLEKIPVDETSETEEHDVTVRTAESREGEGPVAAVGAHEGEHGLLGEHRGNRDDREKQLTEGEKSQRSQQVGQVGENVEADEQVKGPEGDDDDDDDVHAMSDGTRASEIGMGKKRDALDSRKLLHSMFAELERWLGRGVLVRRRDCIVAGSFHAELIPERNSALDVDVTYPRMPTAENVGKAAEESRGHTWKLKCSWRLEDSALGERAVKILLNAVLLTDA